MSLNEDKAPQSSGSNYPLLEAGPKYARCCGIVDLGIQKQEYKGEAKPDAQVIDVIFELPYDRVDIEKDGEETKNVPRWLSKRYTVKTGKKANLTKLKTSLGITNIMQLPKMPVALNVIHDTYTKDGEERTTAKIDTINPYIAPPNDPDFVLPDLEQELRIFDFDEPSKEVWDTLPQWQREKIREAVNFSEIEKVVDGPGATTPTPEAAPTPAPAAEAAPTPAPQAPAPQAAAGGAPVPPPPGGDY